MTRTALMSFDVWDTKYREVVYKYKRQFGSGANAMKKANQESVDWLAKRAAQNLRDDIRRHPDYRHGRLADVLLNPAVHRVHPGGFEFMIHARVDALNARIAAYYRVIEGRPGAAVGSWYWVQRTHTKGPLKMYWQGNAADPGAAAGGRQAGQFARDGIPTVFTNPIPAYHYMARAEEAFIKGNMYGRFARKALRDAGIPVPA